MIELRCAIRADLRRLFDLDQICFPAGIAYSSGEFRSLLNSSRAITAVAEEGEALAGFAIAQTERGRGALIGHIVTIDVAPDFRRRGVGRLLMSRLEKLLAAAGAERLRLEVAIDNSAALRFYDGFGFVVVGQIRGYYYGDLDALVMEKMPLRRKALTR